MDTQHTSNDNAMIRTYSASRPWRPDNAPTPLSPSPPRRIPRKPVKLRFLPESTSTAETNSTSRPTVSSADNIIAERPNLSSNYDNADNEGDLPSNLELSENQDWAIADFRAVAGNTESMLLVVEPVVDRQDRPVNDAGCSEYYSRDCVIDYLHPPAGGSGSIARSIESVQQQSENLAASLALLNAGALRSTPSIIYLRNANEPKKGKWLKVVTIVKKVATKPCLQANSEPVIRLVALGKQFVRDFFSDMQRDKPAAHENTATAQPCRRRKPSLRRRTERDSLKNYQAPPWYNKALPPVPSPDSHLRLTISPQEALEQQGFMGLPKFSTSPARRLVERPGLHVASQYGSLHNGNSSPLRLPSQPNTQTTARFESEEQQRQNTARPATPVAYATTPPLGSENRRFPRFGYGNLRWSGVDGWF